MSDEQNASTTQQVVDTDNSTLDEQISAALDEQDNVQKVEPEKQQAADANKQEDTENKGEPQAEKDKQDNTEIQYPEKFKNADGTLNTKNLLKSYTELEPLLNQKAAWEKEKAILEEKAKFADEVRAQREAEARMHGYESSADWENVQGLVNAVCDEYSKHIYETDDPQYTADLLNRYKVNPSPELMSQIEVEFSSAVNKRVAIAAERKRVELEANAASIAQNNTVNNVKANIAATVDKHKDLLNTNEPVKNLYIKALQKYGDNFTADDADVLFEAIGELKDYFFKEFEAQKNKEKENNDALNQIAGISPNGANKKDVNPIKDISAMTDAEFKKCVYELV